MRKILTARALGARWRPPRRRWRSRTGAAGRARAWDGVVHCSTVANTVGSYSTTVRADCSQAGVFGGFYVVTVLN